MKHSVTVGAQLLWSGRYGYNNGRYGCTIVMSYIEINKAVSQWLLTFNLCVSVTWPLTCAFHIPCTHTLEIIDMHRGVCDKVCIINRMNCPLTKGHYCGKHIQVMTSPWCQLILEQIWKPTVKSTWLAVMKITKHGYRVSLCKASTFSIVLNLYEP